MASQKLFPPMYILRRQFKKKEKQQQKKELKKSASTTESVQLRKALTSHSKFGQDLAAPAACQCHLSPQPVSSLSPGALYPWEGLGARASSGRHLTVSRQPPLQQEGILPHLPGQIPAPLCLQSCKGCRQQEGGGSCQKSPRLGWLTPITVLRPFSFSI